MIERRGVRHRQRLRGDACCAERTGLSLDELAERVEALIVTLGGEGSVIHAGGATYAIPAVKPRRRRRSDRLRRRLSRRPAVRHRATAGTGSAPARLASVLGALKIASRGGQNHAVNRDTRRRVIRESVRRIRFHGERHASSYSRSPFVSLRAASPRACSPAARPPVRDRYYAAATARAVGRAGHRRERAPGPASGGPTRASDASAARALGGWAGSGIGGGVGGNAAAIDRRRDPRRPRRQRGRAKAHRARPASRSRCGWTHGGMIAVVQDDAGERVSAGRPHPRRVRRLIRASRAERGALRNAFPHERSARATIAARSVRLYRAARIACMCSKASRRRVRVPAAHPRDAATCVRALVPRGCSDAERRYALHGALDAADGNVLLVANHMSWLDIFVLQRVAAGALRRQGGARALAAGRSADPQRPARCSSSARAGATRVASTTARRTRSPAATSSPCFPKARRPTAPTCSRSTSSLLQPIVDADGHVQPVAIRYRDADGERLDRVPPTSAT